MKRTKLLSMMLILAMMLSFTACSGGDKNGRDTTAQKSDTKDTTAAPSGAITTELEPIDPELEKLDYDGEAVTILSRGGGRIGVVQERADSRRTDKRPDQRRDL